MKYKVYSLGCKVNQYDGEKLSGLLQSAGFILGEKDADVVVINTCAVTKSAITKSRQAINRARRENPRAKIVVAGCWPKVYKEEFSKKIKVDLILDSANFENYKIKELFGNSKLKIENSKSISENGCLNSLSTNKNRSRYFLKVQDGCEQFCSYCIIPYARGPLQSRKISEILEEAKAAVAAGWQEIVLNGIHLGLFGINNKNKEKEEKNASLLNLLKQLVKVEGLKKIRLSSIEITEVKDDLVKFMARERKMCRHLHIPLQSGSDKILRLMKRPYDKKFFAERVKKIRQAMPDIAISTDVIVGFPGEEEKESAEARKFIEKMKFSRLHVFSFSLHEKAPAFHLPDRVSPAEIKRRADELKKISEELEKKFVEKFHNKIVEAVVEKNKSIPFRGRVSSGKKFRAISDYGFDFFFEKKDVVSLDKRNIKAGEVLKIKMD